MNIPRLILALLIFLGAVLYLVGVLWSFVAVLPETLTNIVSVIGAALATNFGAVLGIEIASGKGTTESDSKNWFKIIRDFLKRISSINLEKLPEYAALLYFIVMAIGSIAFLISGAPASGLSRDLFYALIGAIIAAVTHFLKKKS